MLPGIIQGKKTGEIAVALLGIDLLSSGEHCQTEILCKYGVVSQGNGHLPKQITGAISARYMAPLTTMDRYGRKFLQI